MAHEALIERALDHKPRSPETGRIIDYCVEQIVYGERTETEAGSLAYSLERRLRQDGLR